MRNPIIVYVRNSLGEPYGCVVAIEDAEYGFSVGWSQCGRGDQFRKSIARQIALYRAEHGCDTDPAVYHDEWCGKVDWLSWTIYEVILAAEAKFNAPMV